MIRRLVNGFVVFLISSPAVSVASSAQVTEKDISPAERERVRKLIHRLHVSGGHVSKTSLRLLLQRRGCPVWMQQMVDQLQCDSCLESSDASKTVAGGESRYFRIRRFPKERFLCTLHGCSLQTVVMLIFSGRKSSSAFRAERCDSHFTSGRGLDAAFSAVSVFDFGPWWMFRQ